MQRWARRWQKGTKQVRTSRIEKQDLGLSETHPRPHFHLPVPDLQSVLPFASCRAAASRSPVAEKDPPRMTSYMVTVLQYNLYRRSG